MYRHIVLYTYKSDCTAEAIAGVFNELETISRRLSGRLSYSWGPYKSHEGRSRGYTHALITDFADEAARNAFIDDEVRVEFSKREVLPRMVNGADSIVSFDFEWDES